VVIVGAGFGGLGAGIALKRAGIEDFVILERAEDIGGTWRENTYPDIAVDVPSFSYQFSFEKNPGWSRVFAKGAEVKEYIDHCADKYGLRPHIRLNTEVTARGWDDETHTWRIRTNAHTITARYVITAIGAFIDPKPPDIDGLDDFEGKVICSQRWDHDYDLTGKRVAVIGTGATAVQLIPPVARAAKRLFVFQRRPIWVFAKPDVEIPPAVQQLFRVLPGSQEAVRLAASALVEAGLVGIVLYGERVSALTRIPAMACRAFLFTQVRDRGLRRRLTPEYGFGCKRPAMSNTYYRTFTRSNTELVTDPIERMTPSGIVTADGHEREIDALILATGFRLSHDPENYRKVPVTGRDGFDLGEFFAHEPLQAYEGVSLPQLPNTFMIFGPYSWSGSSWHVMVEIQSHHAVRVIQEARRRRATMAAVRPEANERFLRFVRDRARESILYSNNCETANTYYFDHHDDFSLLRPTTAMQAWWASRRFPLDDYRYESLPPPAVDGRTTSLIHSAA
jgi:cation diffusion facilitator CzcD-associated flavoprotein CzcO